MAGNPHTDPRGGSGGGSGGGRPIIYLSQWLRGRAGRQVVTADRGVTGRGPRRADRGGGNGEMSGRETGVSLRFPVSTFTAAGSIDFFVVAVLFSFVSFVS